MSDASPNSEGIVAFHHRTKQGMISFFSVFQLVIAPPVLSTGTFVMVIRMLVIMCASCPDLAVVLLKQSKSLSREEQVYC